MTNALSTWLAEPVPERIVQLFALLHGRYGNVFSDRYRNGVVRNGEDLGTLAALRTWADDLAPFDDLTLNRAFRESPRHHPTWPPTGPEFVALCKRMAPKVVPKAAPALEMSTELKSKYVTECRDAIRKTLARRAGTVMNANGLPGLLANLARAVALAGGDEVATLRRLESDFLTVRF